MNIEITIFEVTSENISGLSKGSGKPYSFNKQPCYMDEGKPVLSETSIMHDDNEKPLNKGVFKIKDEAVYIDRNGRISINVTQQNLEYVRPLVEKKSS